jgi:hypothetical protein
VKAFHSAADLIENIFAGIGDREIEDVIFLDVVEKFGRGIFCAASTSWSAAYTRTSARAPGLACPRTQPAINAHSGSSLGVSAAPGDSVTRRSTP